MCFGLDQDSDICTMQPDGSMLCVPKDKLYENDGKTHGTTEGDKSGTTDKDKNTAVTPGTSAVQEGKGWGEKYPNGLGGVWMVKSKELQNTSVGKLASKVMPTDIKGGEYPSWHFEFDVPYIGYVSHDFSLPPYVWLGLRMIVLALASVFAFRLIFGGA